MITRHNGDLLKSDCDIICHQVNLQGIMGGGLAYQIAQKYPDCEKEYIKYVKQIGKKAFSNWYAYIGDIVICNCFTQREDFTTDYKAVREVFTDIRKFAKIFNSTVGIPYKYGCGIAKGNWVEIEKIIEDVFGNSDVECQIWKLEINDG